MRRNQFRDALAAYFEAHPGQWVSAYALMEVAGKMAWRTRCSECRRQLGMRIDNEVRRDASGRAESFYRYTPQGRLFGEVAW
jgi:hypothetical protein